MPGHLDPGSHSLERLYRMIHTCWGVDKVFVGQNNSGTARRAWGTGQLCSLLPVSLSPFHVFWQVVCVEMMNFAGVR